MRFSTIAITAPFLWLFGNHNQPPSSSSVAVLDRTIITNTSETDPLAHIPETDPLAHIPETDLLAHISETDSSLILPLVFVIFGLIVEVIILQKKKKKIRITQGR